MYPPKFEIISQESKEMRERKKNTPFLKKSPGEKSNTPLFLQFSGRTLLHEKYPFTGHFGNTHAVIPTSEWGRGRGQDLQDNQFYITKRQYFKETKHWEVTNTCIIERMFITLF